jgi:hypothetical protein
MAAAAVMPKDEGRGAGSRAARPAAGRPGAAVDPLEAAVLVAAALVGLVLRWKVMSGPLGYLDYDEASVGIQARTYFEDPAVFFPGQAYGGTLEVLATATLFQVASNAFVLKLVPIILHATAALIAWRAALRLVPSRTGQLLVPVLLWIGPAFGVWESTKGRGFYGMAVVLAALAMLLVLRVDEAPSAARYGLFGLAAGVAFWTTPLLVLVYVPCGAWLLVRCRFALVNASWMVAGAIVGAAPSLLWNQRHGWDGLSGPTQQDATTVEILRNGLAKVPALIGLATPWEPDRVLVPGAAVLAGVLLVLVITVASLRTEDEAPGLLATVLIGYLVLYAFVVPLGAMGPDLRYLYPVLPVLALAIGALVPRPVRRHGTAALLAAATVVVGLVSWWGITGMAAVGPTDTNFLSSPGIPEVTGFLEGRGVDTAITDVAGTQITFESEGRIEAASFAAPRFRHLQAVMWDDGPSAYVLETDRSRNDERLEQVARERGISFERRRFGEWTVYLLDERLAPWDAELTVFGGRLTEQLARDTAGGTVG